MSSRFICQMLQLASLLALVAGPGVASARPLSQVTSLEEMSKLEYEAFELLETDAERGRLRYLQIGARYTALGADEKLGSVPLWRAARCYWLAAEALPIEERPERSSLYRTAVDMAARGLARDPDCAECMLWKFVALGRIGTTDGLVAGLRAAPEMASLLDQGIALAPTHRDGANNSTLGNLHYASAIFYRVLPDWRWLGWVIGVRGDKQRALDHARVALSLHPQRLDYKVELGSQLLCIGASDERQESLTEGSRLLRSALHEQVASVLDERQVAAAQVMLEAPAKSCGFTGADWVEIDARKAAAAAAGG